MRTLIDLLVASHFCINGGDAVAARSKAKAQAAAQPSLNHKKIGLAVPHLHMTSRFCRCVLRGINNLLALYAEPARKRPPAWPILIRCPPIPTSLKVVCSLSTSAELENLPLSPAAYQRGQIGRCAQSLSTYGICGAVLGYHSMPPSGQRTTNCPLMHRMVT